MANEVVERIATEFNTVRDEISNSSGITSASSVLMNGSQEAGVLGYGTQQVTGSTPILYTGQTIQTVDGVAMTEIDASTWKVDWSAAHSKLQVANDNGDGVTLAPDWSAIAHTVGDIVIDNSDNAGTHKGDSLAYRCLVPVNNDISPRYDVDASNGNWVLETNQYGGRFWDKNRSGTHSHSIIDTIRGHSKLIRTNDTSIEAATTDLITSINTKSITIGENGNINTLSDNYVLWIDQTIRKTAGYRTDAGVMQNSKNNTGTDLMAKDSAGNPIIEHYNPITGFSIIMDTGNGVAGRTISHSQQKVPKFIVEKRLTGVAYSWATYNAVSGATDYQVLNGTDASASNIAMWNNTEPTENNYTVGSTSYLNALNEQYITYLQCDSDNHKTKGYGGTGAVGNVVELGLDMTVAGSWCMIKRLDGVAAWIILDNKRLGSDSIINDYLLANDSAVEVQSTTFNTEFTSTGVVLNGLEASYNTAGGQYLIQAYSPKYAQPTGGTLIDINANKSLTYTQGLNTPNLLETTTSESLDLSSFAGQTAYIFKEYGVSAVGSDSELLVGQSRPLGLYGDELVSNGVDFINTTGWTAGNGATLSVDNGRLKILQGATDYGFGHTNIATVIGNKYILNIDTIAGNHSDITITVSTYIPTAESDYDIAYSSYTNGVGLRTIEFIATSTTVYVASHNVATTDNLYHFIDNISVKQTDAPYQGSYLNTVDKRVYNESDVAKSLVAIGEFKVDDQGGSVFDMVEYPELKSYFNDVFANDIEANDVKANGEFIGKNTCTAWVNFDGTTTPPTIRDSFNVSDVVRTATGRYDIYFEKGMDNANYSVSGCVSTAYGESLFASGLSTLTKFDIYTMGHDGVLRNNEITTTQVFGGK